MKNAIDMVINGDEVKGLVSVYGHNNMPAVLAISMTEGPYMDLTTNGKLYIEDALSVRSDNQQQKELLLKYGLIEDELLFSHPSGFIDIHYYQMTEKARELYEIALKNIEENTHD